MCGCSSKVVATLYTFSKKWTICTENFCTELFSGGTVQSSTHLLLATAVITFAKILLASIACLLPAMLETGIKTSFVITSACDGHISWKHAVIFARRASLQYPSWCKHAPVAVNVPTLLSSTNQPTFYKLYTRYRIHSTDCYSGLSIISLAKLSFYLFQSCSFERTSGIPLVAFVQYGWLLAIFR